MHTCLSPFSVLMAWNLRVDMEEGKAAKAPEACRT